MGDKRGQLDAMLDVALVLPTADTVDLGPKGRALAAGAELGRYRLDRKLGAGRTGTVWEGHDGDRHVALEVLHAGTPARVASAARALVAVRHANVIAIHEVAAIDGHDVIAMAFVAGEPLPAWLAAGRRPGAIVAVIVAVARGLAAARAAGVTHGDLSPRDVLVTRRGPVVTGFGRGDGDDRAAVVAMLTEALGRVPRRLAAVLARPWPTPDALAGAIERAWRRPRRIAIAGAALAVAAAGAAIATHHAAWQPTTVVLAARVETSDGTAISPDGATLAFASDRDDDGWSRLYVEPLAGGPPRAITPRDQAFHAPRWTRDGSALLAVAWDYAGGGDRVVSQPLAGGTPTDLGPGVAVDDCGDALAIVEVARDAGSVRSTLVLRRADGSRVALASDVDDRIAGPRCDPDGQRIAFTRGPVPALAPRGDVWIVDRAGHQTQLTTGRTTGDAVFADGGRSVVFAATRGPDRVGLYEIPSGGGGAPWPWWRVADDAGVQLYPDVSRDDRTLVYEDHAVSTALDIVGGGKTRTLTKDELLLLPMPTRDGERVVLPRARGTASDIVVIATRDGSERVLADGRVPFPTLDGRRVLFGSVDAPYALWSVPIDGGVPAMVARLPGRMLLGVDGPDGAHLVVDRDGRDDSLHVTADGRVEPDGADGLVIPAPSGPWRAIMSYDALGMRFVLEAPGAATLELHGTTTPTWLDDHRFGYARSGQFHVVDVTRGAEVETIPGPRVTSSAALAADGVRWFRTRELHRVTRRAVVDFGDR